MQRSPKVIENVYIGLTIMRLYRKFLRSTECYNIMYNVALILFNIMFVMGYSNHTDHVIQSMGEIVILPHSPSNL